MKRLPANRRSARGAALLTAMLTVTLVASFAAAAMWQQWRAAEIEAAERTRVQSAWVLVAALDWSRLILREDARASGGAQQADHLAEPWAVPLEEARLSSFLAADKNIASDAIEGLPDAFMSGRIVDAQSKLNVANLVVGGKPVPGAVAAFTRLFDLLGLPAAELGRLTVNLQRASAGLAPAAVGTGGGGGAGTAALGSVAGSGNSGSSGTSGTSGTSGSGDNGGGSSEDAGSVAPLMPQQFEQLVWLGLAPGTVAALAPYATLLPVPTPLNINTASAEALSASVAGLDLASAKRLVTQRTNRFFAQLDDAKAFIPESTATFAQGQQSVSTGYFEVHGRLRLDRIWVEEHSLVKRDGSNLTVVWRQRGVGATLVPQKP